MTEKLKNYLLLSCVFLCAMIPDVFGARSQTLVDAQRGVRSFIAFSPDNPYLPIIILIGIFLVLATFYFPRFGLVIMLFFIMISTDLPVGKGDKVRTATVRYEDVILLLVSIGWILNRAKTRTLSSIKDCPIYKPMLAMAAIIVLATISGYFMETVGFQSGLLYSMKRLEYFWIFFMTYNLMETRKEAWISINLFLGVASIVAVIGLIQSALFPLSDLAQGGSTATAGLGRANTLADFYLIILGVSLGLYIHNRNKKWMSIYLGLIGMFVFAIIMTKSRGAYVSIPFIILLITYVSKSKKLVVILVSILMFFLLYHMGSLLVTNQNAELLMNKHNDEIKDQFASIGNVIEKGPKADSSFNARYTAWINTIPEVMKYPILGHGVGSVPLYYFDNQYVTELFDTGFIGLGVFLYLNLIIFISVLNFYRTSNDEFYKGLSLGFLGGHIGILIHGATITNFYTIINMEAFWFILAILMLLYHLQKKTQAQESADSSPAHIIHDQQ
ncbi:MAG: O-antigen ligase family protein [Victivallales bacterium]